MKIELNLTALGVKRVCDFYGEEVKDVDYVDITEMIEEIISDLPDLVFVQDYNELKKKKNELEDRYEALKLAVKDFTDRL